MSDKNHDAQNDSNPKDLIGAKKDPISLVPTEGIRQIAKAMKYGAYEAKQSDGTLGYGPYNWRNKKVQYSIYLDAIMRHALKIVDREDLDTDSGQHHLGHIGANVCLLLDALKHGNVIDNRPPIYKNTDVKQSINVPCRATYYNEDECDD